MKIAMWSGPRNLSTAMMYAFGARSDFAVVDEPFYAAYLAESGADHPMRTEILAAQDNGFNLVAADISGSNPGGKPHFYQKHMTHHMLPGSNYGWISDVTNVFLIRHPVRVIASYAKKRESPNLSDIGFEMQADILDRAVSLGLRTTVIDCADIRANPSAALQILCKAIDLDFDPAMLHWPAGGHRDDGVWASHWYGAVHQSTGFAGREGDLPELSGEYAALAEQAMPIYDRLRAQSLVINS